MFYQASTFVLALCTVVCGHLVRPSSTRNNPAFRISPVPEELSRAKLMTASATFMQGTAVASPSEPSMAMLMTGRALAKDANPLGDAAASHAKNYMMIFVVVIGAIVVCCILGTVGTVAAVGVVVYNILSDPFIQMAMETSKKLEEVPDEVKIHVNSMELKEWAEKIIKDNQGKTLNEIVEKVFGPELAKDDFFVKTCKEDKTQKEWKAWGLMIVLQYFETIQFITKSKISLPKLGVKLPPKPVSVDEVQKMRKSVQADLPDDIQKHVNSEEFTQFCLRHFMEEFQAEQHPGQRISLNSVAKAVQKAYPTGELIEDMRALEAKFKQEKDNKTMDAECFREVFMYFECLLYKKLGMISLDSKGVRVPKGFKVEKAGPPPTLEEQATPALQDA